MIPIEGNSLNKSLHEKDFRRIYPFLLKLLHEFAEATNQNEIEKVFNHTRTFCKECSENLINSENDDFLSEYIEPLQKTLLQAIPDSFSILNCEHNKPELSDELYESVQLAESQTRDLYKILEKAMLKLMKKDIDLSQKYQNLLSSIRRLEKISGRCLSIALLFHYAKKGGIFSKSPQRIEPLTQ